MRLENGAAERTSQLNCCRQISTNLQPASRIADASTHHWTIRRPPFSLLSLTLLFPSLLYRCSPLPAPWDLFPSTTPYRPPPFRFSPSPLAICGLFAPSAINTQPRPATALLSGLTRSLELTFVGNPDTQDAHLNPAQEISKPSPQGQDFSDSAHLLVSRKLPYQGHFLYFVLFPFLLSLRTTWT